MRRRLGEVYDAVDVLTKYLNARQPHDDRTRTVREAVYSTLAGELLRADALERHIAQLTTDLGYEVGGAAWSG